MDMSLIELWAQMGIWARGVVVSLFLMGIAVVAITIDRLWALRRWSRESKTVAEKAANAIKGMQYAHLLAEVKDDEQPLPRVLRAGIGAYLEATKSSFEHETAVEMAKRELLRELEVIYADCRRGMGLLASVASVSPFVGLFGTVLGIIAAFQGIAKTGSGGLGSVAAGIAEALIVTGIGLGVAIPAVMLFNMLNGKIDRFDLLLKNAAGELADQLEKNHIASSTQREPRLAA